MDLHLCNHKSNSRHIAHKDGHLLLFFEGGELRSFRRCAIYIRVNTVLLPKKNHDLFMEGREFICIIMSLGLSSHSPYSFPLQFCKLSL